MEENFNLNSNLYLLSNQDNNYNVNLLSNQDNNYNVYLLKNQDNNKTYVGITNNLIRRLRQHNNEIKGGARYTTNNSNKWYYYGYIQNLNKSQALSLEKKIKLTKSKGKTPIEKRLFSINENIIKFNNMNEKKISFNQIIK
jgi:putative endonuclease